MEAEQIARKVLEEHGIMKGVKVEEAPLKPSFEAFTDLRNSQTTLRYNPEFNISRRARKFAGKKRVAKPLEKCVRDVTAHECGHITNRKRKACPETLEEHEEHFYNPIGRILKKKGKLGSVDSITNLVEDLIDNTLLAQGEHAGLTLFYDDVARTKGWGPAYEAYMHIQMYSWGDSLDRKLLTPYYTNNSEVIKAVQEFLGKLKGLVGKEKRLTHEEIANYFSQKKNWKIVAEEFTKAIEPLIPPQIDIPMCGFGKEMEKAMKDPSNRERFARKHYEKGSERPSWMSKEEALDAVYSSMAREIQVLVDSLRKATSLPIIPFQYEPFDVEEHELKDVNFRKPLIVPERETAFGLEGLSFGVPEQYIERPLMVKKGITSFPEFKCAYIDSSDTMRYGIINPEDSGSEVFIPWGDNSRYHYLCKAWYGIIEYLARQQILPNVNVTLGSFSTSSRVKQGLDEAKNLLFNPEFGMTNMDNEAVNQLINGGKSVFFTVSDGEVSNWDSVKQAFIDKAKEHYYFHIQIGPHTAMTKDLGRAKLPVYTVSKGEDLERMAIDLTSKAYQSYIDEALELAR